MARLTSHALLLALVASCGSCKSTPSSTSPLASADASASLPAPDPAFLLLAAGAPVGTFGPADAPTFEAGFDALRAAGFNAFMPFFLTTEAGESAGHEGWFYAGELGPRSCVTTNPYDAARGRIDIVFPAQPLVAEPPNEPLDRAAFRARLAGFVKTCLHGDRSLVKSVYAFDEPASGYVASTIDTPTKPFVLANVRAVADEARAVLPVPVVLVEAALPWALPFVGASPADVGPLTERFEKAVAETAPAADVYGFDAYPIDLVPDVTVVAEYAQRAAQIAVGKKPIAVVQGFGYADMKMPQPVGTGRRPTRDELRASAWAAIAGGARGLVYYGQSALRVGDGPLWDDLRAVVTEVARYSGVLTAPSSVDPTTGAVRVARFTVGEDVYVVVVNTSAKEASAEIAWSGSGGVRDTADGSAVALSTSLSLPPFGVRVFVGAL